MKKILNIFFWGLTINSLAQSNIKEVGILDKDFFAHAQEKTNWCWAASIQTILGYHNVLLSQTEIVDRTFGKNQTGELPNFVGSVQVISDNLNNWEIDLLKRPIKINSVFYPYAPTPNELINFLKNKQPIYISYKSSLSTNHAIVITSCRYIETNGSYNIIDFTARDPWPSVENVNSDGIVKYNYLNFSNKFNYFWIISTRLKGHISIPIEPINNCSSPFCETLKTILKDYGNNFNNLKSQKITTKIFKSKIIFPNEVTSQIRDFEGLNYDNDGKVFPSYKVTFYKGTIKDSSIIMFENLKSNFNFLNILLEENTNSDTGIFNSKNKSVHMYIGDGIIISLNWRYDEKPSKYYVNMEIQSEIEVKQLHK